MMDEILPLKMKGDDRSVLERETGPSSKVLVTGWADMALSHASYPFVHKCHGLAIFLKDSLRRGYYVMMIDFLQGRKVVDIKVNPALSYERNELHPTAHTIVEQESEDAVGFVFKDSLKANMFYDAVTEKIKHLRTKRETKIGAMGTRPVAGSDFTVARTPAPTLAETPVKSPKKIRTSKNKLEALPDLPPPNPAELGPVEGETVLSNGNKLFKRLPKKPKQQPNGRPSGLPLNKPNIDDDPEKFRDSPVQPKLPTKPTLKNCNIGQGITLAPSSLPFNSRSHSQSSSSPSSPPIDELNSRNLPPKPAVNRNKKPNIRQSGTPPSTVVSPTSPMGFDPSQILEFKKFPKKSFTNASHSSNSPSASQEMTSGNTSNNDLFMKNVRIRRSASTKEDTNITKLKVQPTAYGKTSPKHQNNTITDANNLRACDSPPPPPIPSQIDHLPLKNLSIHADSFAGSENENFPPPPPLSELREEFNAQYPMNASQLNWNANSNPNSSPEGQPKSAPFTQCSDPRGGLLAALQSNNPTGRLRKVSAPVQSELQKESLRTNNMMDILKQSLDARRGAIDNIYKTTPEDDSEDDWSG